MYNEKDYKELAAEWVNDITESGYHGAYLPENGVINLLWKSYEQGYQDRIDDFDGMEEGEGLSDWERNR